MINYSSPNTIKTLDDITRRKEELQLGLDGSKTIIVSSVKGLFAPPPAVTNSSSALMRNLGTGLVIFNGVKTGFKIIRIVKSLFKRFK